ncbi:bifunctional (p)ppGpp synthetase/guanosine-3',5'-bis(diphosphate) 3'-pyrophosphohydrolase [uncultured Clostridium sp.]|uniref:RelA/SpoT family protein n=1 Tax=uncultured Clostridium sp. TaxID=59620 RepID=UPI0025E20D74|nr:bifunctional (p)ppGpp synthetase/guanosine-3',5'-bis(diphosphate) 3'-pyrophosphohydrolase [uncultured Clostridium sp.]
MLDKLLEKIDENNTSIDKKMVEKAFYFAESAHAGQKRESGEDYIIHPIEVACILAEMGLDTSTIIAGLIHDVIEDTKYTYDDVAKRFSTEVANLVDGVTKLGKIKFQTKEEEQANNVRKMLLAMTKDIRVILIKLADRLHNMRTLKYMPENKQKEKAKETLDIYAPLAHRLGISKIKWELEDLSFRYLNPEEYYDLVDKIAAKRTEREADIKEILKEVSEILDNAGINAEIDGRPKHFYSIYKKMVTKGKSIDEVFDLMAFRIIVNSIKDCYAVLGMVHTLYKPIPGRFKDYIAMPKPNMYQSLHTTVLAKDGKPFEIQIRTFEMHKTAEYGIAAHWQYKEGTTNVKESDIQSKLAWIREVIEWQRDEDNPKEFMENFKIDLFSDEVFVFTPRGKVINLPHGATPIDLAYRIHTDVGNRCIGAKVNGRIVSLDYELKTGEIVEILTSSIEKGPNIDWLSTVKSNQAKTKIRAWFKKQKREENILKGKELLEREAKKQGHNFGEVAKSEILEKLFRKYNFNNIEDLEVSVGIGNIIASNVITKLLEVRKPEVNLTVDDVKESIAKNKNKIKKSSSYGIVVKGETDIYVRYAKCCNPVPGDEVMGYITKGRGVSVHRKDCRNLFSLINTDPSRVVEVEWSGVASEEFVAEIDVRGDDRFGLLNDVMKVISETKIAVEGINAKTSKEYEAQINLKVKVANIKILNDLIKRIKNIRGIYKVFRTNN